MGDSRRRVLPFTALVGQSDLKLGLVANLVNPRIGGLLIQGPKGTGKSTAVRALAELLPEREEVVDCPYRCSPGDRDSLCAACRSREGESPTRTGRMRVVNLPLSTTEDRLVGAVDMELVLSRGEKAFKPGVLADANRNILYVDEINLLPDHIADDILDAAALGTNTVEREGFSLTHPASFVLVGTMNPEEGSLRPQLLDRLPLSVTLETIRDPGQRVEIVRRNATDPDRLHHRFAKEEAALAEKIARAQGLLARVRMPSRYLEALVHACIELRVDGHRPEIVITRTAMTLAAFRARKGVTEADLSDAARLALSHRTRDGGFEPPATREEIEEALRNGLARSSSDEGEDLAFGGGAGLGDAFAHPS